MPNIAEATAQLTAPGAPFEIVREDVGGVPTKVFKTRLRSMGELMAMADGRGDAEFVVQGDRRLTFAAHNAAARRMANRLIERGLARGDRIALLAANNPDWVVTFWAAAAANAVCVPLNAWWKRDELAFALEDCGATVLVCDERRHASVADVLKSLPSLSDVYVIGSREYDDLFRDAPADAPAVDVDEDDVCGIFYTSGTTGRSKGATVTHRQVLANLQNQFVLGIATGMASGTPPVEAGSTQAAALLVVPLFHTTGCHATMVLNYAAGGKLVLMPPGRFDPEAAMRVIQDERVTSIGGVPTIMWRIVESPRRHEYDLSSVSRISYGGAPAAPELVQRIAEAFPNARSGLATAYGLTETASVATANTADDYLAHPDSVGRAVATVEVRIVDPSGADVPTGDTGEIWLKGPTISVHGYWNRPDANAASFTDGWFHTGDIGRLDADGFLFIVDRAKDMVIRAGENIYCVEIENVLHEHPDVLDAAVVGVPHRTLGEQVKAVVQRRPGSSVDADELRAFCRGRLADFKVPECVAFVDEPLPRNPAGKVLKAALRGEGTSFAVDDASDSAL